MKRRILIPKVKNKKGETINTRQGIANVFAEFYESLYEGEEDDEEKGTESRTEEDESIPDHYNHIREFTKNEIQDAFDRTKKGKTKDSSGVRAEQLKNCSDDTKENSETSSMKSFEKKTSHRKVGARSEFKSSTKKVTEKMQAITGHFAACQCFLNRLPQYYIDDKIQPPDQGGFQPNHRTEDHLMLYRVLKQRCREWAVPLYISTIDFTKAFDRIKHSALWTSLQYHGIEPAYIRHLQRVTCFRSKGYEAGRTLCPLYSSTQCCNFLWRKI